jgi:hypothetical protein
MSLVFRFRVIFEDVDNVVRVIDVSASNTFKDFHHKIQEAIGFDNIQEASFFKANDIWRKDGDEFCTEGKEDAREAGACELGKFIDDPHQKFLYIYDPKNGDWHLRAELIKLFRAEAGNTYPHVFKIDGVAPKQFIDPKLIISDPSAKLFKEADSLIGGLTDDIIKDEIIEDEDDLDLDDDFDEDEDEIEDEKDEFNLFGDEVDESEIDESQINDGIPTE